MSEDRGAEDQCNVVAPVTCHHDMLLIDDFKISGHKILIIEAIIITISYKRHETIRFMRCEERGLCSGAVTPGDTQLRRNITRGATRGASLHSEPP